MSESEERTVNLPESGPCGEFSVQVPVKLRESATVGWEASCGLCAELGPTPLEALNALERALIAKGLKVTDGEFDYPEAPDAG